ncbi:Very low-density lipoprotein receptor [Thelohanellus kitauei]|uniref:Very low-density lipoprotein receptor n=1 Tax=Thelohanellus kitauei TaxID=669202 RepID=A0A0C2NCQ6_THEKT|nr:Very low-density lipoprotein receptor [Thelohanellus kitauei]
MCYNKSHKCDGFNDCNDGFDEYQCPMKNKCSLDDSFECEPNICVGMNNFCNGIRDCKNGKDEPRLCAIESVIVHLGFTFDHKSTLRLFWSGNRLNSKTSYHITVKNWDTKKPYLQRTQIGSRELFVPFSKTCIRVLVVVKLTQSSKGRSIQFLTSNQGNKEPTNMAFDLVINKISWSYPEQSCLPIVYFIFCYLNGQLVIKTSTFHNFLLLGNQVDRCSIASCPRNVFNRSCSSFSHIEVAYNRFRNYEEFVVSYTPVLLFIILCTIFIKRRLRFAIKNIQTFIRYLKCTLTRRKIMFKQETRHSMIGNS